MNSSKPVILILLAHYLPGYKCGGPIRTIANLVDHLGDEFEFKIITSDRDMLEKSPFQEVQVDEWNTVGKAKVFYGSPNQFSFRRLPRLVSETPHDILYINSFFWDKFSIFPLLMRKLRMFPRKPVILAPRGEFSDGALALKTFKKRSFLRVAKLIGLHCDLTWQASSEFEKEDIRREMGEVAKRIFVAPDLLPKAPISEVHLQESNEADSSLRIVFLSRISPKKNLDYAIEVLKKVSVPVVFDIYGVLEDSVYWEKCKEQMNNLPCNVKASYRGEINHSDVHAVLAEYDLFFFPTRGENFGHVIFEALAAGLPALISDQTPWKDLETKGVGWGFPLEAQEQFLEVIYTLFEVNKIDRIRQREEARKYAIDYMNQGATHEANRVLFNNLSRDNGCN